MLHRNSPALLLSTLALAPLCVVGGCDRDADSTKVSDAATVMNVQNVESVTDSHNEIIGLLNSVSSAASAGTTEAAASLMGGAKTGVATTKAQEAQALEFDLREMGLVVRSTTAKWQRLDAQSKAAAQISAADELNEIATLIEQRRAERETYLAAKARFDEQVAQLDTQIAEFEGRAAAQRDEAGKLQLQLSQVSATEAASLAERIREFTLKADAFDRRASELTTARDQITPEAREAALNVEKIETQLQLLDRQRAEAQAREQSAKEDASSARAAADTVASELRNLATELTTFVEEQLVPAFAAVNSEISASQQSTRKGRTITRPSSDLTSAATLQAQGIVESRRSAALEEVARVFESLAAAGVIPNAKQTADEYHQKAIEAHGAASEAFTAAASAMRGVSLNGREFRSVNERLKEAADTLDRLAATPFGQVPDLTAPPVVEDDAFSDEFEDEQPADDASEEPLDEI